MKLFKPLILCVSLAASMLAQATEIIIYENKPVIIKLHQGEERSIQFGDHVEVGITKGQQMKRLFRVQSAQGAVHFLPYEEFDRQRVQIKRLTDGRVILLDLIASPKPEGAEELESVKILLESENAISVDEASKSELFESHLLITPVDLTRYVSQRLYGPTRLHHDVPGISESAVDVVGAIRIFRGEAKLKTLAKAVVAYSGGGYNIAGILIRNTSDTSVSLDYLDLNLPFTQATLQHHSLSPAGSPGDSTVLYLVTERSLKEALQPWTYFHDLEAERKAMEGSRAEINKQVGRNEYIQADNH